MRVIGKTHLLSFLKKNSSAANFLKSWYWEMAEADWKDLRELKKQYPDTEIDNTNRAIFKMKDETYFIVAKFDFNLKAIFIRFAGTKKQFGQINPHEV